MVHIESLFENDCDLCYPLVAIDRDTAVVMRDEVGIQFFSTTNSSFEIITKIDIDYITADVAINGNTAVIGSYITGAITPGAVYIYEREQNGTWSQAMRIQPSNLSQGAWSGCSIAIDGNVMVVGAPADGEEALGSAYIYRRIEGTWIKVAKLTPADNSNALNFGYFVSVKGTSIAVGDPGLCLGGNK